MIPIGILQYFNGGYRRAITIDYTKVGGTTLTNYVVLISITDATLKSVSNGGHVNYTSGNDIVFSTNSSISVLTNWEIEKYDPLTGNLVAWVKIPSVSSSTNTVFYINYGDINRANTFVGGNPWTLPYAVYHLGDGSTLSTNDSTTNSQTLTNVGSVSSVSGVVRGGANFNGSNYLIKGSAVSQTNTSNGWKMSFWFKLSANTNNVFMSVGSQANFFSRIIVFYNGAGSIGVNRGDGNTRSFSWTYDTNWNHLFITGSGSLDSINFYLNGVLKTSTGGVSQGLASFPPNQIVLGGTVGTGTSGTAGYNGYLDEIRYQAGQILPNEALADYNNQNSPSTFSTLGSEF